MDPTGALAPDGLDARDWDDGTDATLRMAVVGCGGYTRNVSLPAIAAADYAEPGVVVSGTPETRDALTTEYDVRALDYDAYAAHAATDAYDAVYVATPNGLHLPHVKTAAEAGKAVICEKPLEATVDRAEQLVDACRESNVPLMTAYRMQTDPVIRRLRAFLEAGGIGDVTRVGGDFTFPVLGSRGPDQWRLDPELAGGGALFDVGVYPLNTSRFLLGTDPVAVSATVRSSPPIAAVDEHTDFRVEFDQGTVGNFSASFSGHPNTELTILGEDGRVTVRSAFEPGRDRTVVVETDTGRVELDGLGADETREEFDYFAHAVLTDRTIEPDGTDGLIDMRTMAAALESAKQGERVAVPLSEDA